MVARVGVGAVLVLLTGSISTGRASQFSVPRTELAASAAEVIAEAMYAAREVALSGACRTYAFQEIEALMIELGPGALNVSQALEVAREVEPDGEFAPPTALIALVARADLGKALAFIEEDVAVPERRDELMGAVAGALAAADTTKAVDIAHRIASPQWRVNALVSVAAACWQSRPTMAEALATEAMVAAAGIGGSIARIDADVDLGLRILASINPGKSVELAQAMPDEEVCERVAHVIAPALAARDPAAAITLAEALAPLPRDEAILGIVEVLTHSDQRAALKLARRIGRGECRVKALCAVAAGATPACFGH